MIITDLDGTLLNDDQKISDKNYQTLKALSEKSICRVIATGRSLFSFLKVIPENFPIDFLIFSTGAGIIDWKSKELIYKNSIPTEDVIKISKTLKERQLNFMIHKPVPENHHFCYYTNSHVNNDFERRCKLYNSYARKLEYHEEYQKEACQLITMFDEAEEEFNEVAEKLANFKVVRTTSPLNGSTVWMEIFPKHVSKGKTIDWLCNYLDIKSTNTLAIGNDYNDIDMLEYTSESYVVKNAPDSLKEKYNVVPSNNNNGFSVVANNFFDELL